ncbi:claspin-like [Aricia agestis]|uniref:claspin-like n=1 Tax=Aricia agestis TaxID=91739 RepID=UPI001C205F2E|nr:claspin-like [Aricia agestis]
MEVSPTPLLDDESNISNVNRLILGETYSSDDEDVVRRRTQRKRNVTDSDSDVDNADPKKSLLVTKTRIRMMSDNDSDSQEPNNTTDKKDSSKTSRIRSISNSDTDTQGRHNASENNSEEEDEDPTNKSSLKNKTKSRITSVSNSDSDSQEQPTTTYKSSRVENRKTKLYDKFKALSSSQVKNTVEGSDSEHRTQISDESDERLDEEVSCLKIKKKIIKKKNALSSICDADTSDEDVDKKLDLIKHQKKIKPKALKSAIEIQPKMSAKQAMENMQKIKSESNRMLREKDVSLPYHKPRALSLQDIMKRKRPALTSDGKVMPIKMSNEQLAEYVKLLEERQKEIIELCKSDSEEEAVVEDSLDKTNNTQEAENIVDNNKQELDKTSDDLYDTVIQESNISSANHDVSVEKVDEKTQEENKISDKTHDEAQSEVIHDEKHDSESEIAGRIQEDGNKIKESSVNADLSALNSSNQDNEEISLKYLDSSTENVAEDLQYKRHAENNSVDQTCDKPDTSDEAIAKVMNNSEALCQNSSNLDSQAISLQFDSENILSEIENNKENNVNKDNIMDVIDTTNNYIEEKEKHKYFSDDDNDDFNIDDIDTIIENAEIIKDNVNLNTSKPTTTTMPTIPILKPTLTGSPGMFINLESDDQSTVLTGVDLLKERFTYFSKLKTAEEMEKNRLQKHKPGLQHLKLKHELEEQIAAQRSLEWEKRLEEEKQLKSEMTLEPEDDIEKIEAKLNEEEIKESSSSEEEDLVEDDVEMKDAPRKSNPMIDDEAEESNEEDDNVAEVPDNDDEQDEDANENDSSNSSSEESSSESDEETSNKPKKGRILKAFEDSDDEVSNEKQAAHAEATESHEDTPAIKNGNEVQDEEIQPAQLNRSISDDIFATQESLVKSISNTQDTKTSCDIPCTADLGSQTFSILDSTVALNKKDKQLADGTISVTQSIDESTFDKFNKKSTGSLTQDLLLSQPLSSQSQEIGDDIAALCTGKFYDNPFVTQTQDYQNNLEEPMILASEANKITSQDASSTTENDELNKTEEKQQPKDNLTDVSNKKTLESNERINGESEESKPVEDGNLLKSILDELNEPEVETTNRFFGAKQESQVKKRFIIDSDDEDGEEANKEKKKKLKKRKPEKRALQISDDEEGEEDEEESEIEEDVDKIVEYDSEENEIEVQAKPVKKKRIGEFFENEAELTSEDEWVGSGDEDEADLDRMEREEGDNEVFHQGQLQRELGEIHMREVLDQDKREVRLLQELLFEDGDLGDGHRQRKFRWKNDGDADDGTGMGDVGLADTQEEEFESEELWRKQRHERELFLKSLQENEEEKTNTTFNRTALIKANLNSSKTASKDENKNQIEAEAKPPAEPKTTKDLPSPKKQFLILKQSYHGSLLSRGQGALARLAALATPLAADADAPRPKPTAGPGNFVFATLSQPDTEPKVTKRKAETKADTPRLLKKMKTDDSQDKLFPYAEENVKKFLENQWDNDDVKEAVNALRKLAIEDKEKSVDGVVDIPGEDASKDEQIEGLVNNVKWQMSSDRKAGPLKELQGLIWKQGYDSGDIKGHVFDDVSSALEQWQSVDDQKVYIYSSGSVQAQKLLFGQSLAGDLLKYIDGHFDTAVGGKQESTSYTAIVEKIGCSPGDILFLTDILKEAEAARSAGLHAALVSREGNAALPDDAGSYPVINSLSELSVSNKRKTDPQEAEQPAKIAKTDATEDLTVPTETEKAGESEKMEVEEKSESPENETEPQITDKVKEITVIEEVTDAKDAEAVTDIEPIITEVNEDENVKEKEVEKMETDTVETTETVAVEDSKITETTDNNPTEEIKTPEEVKANEVPNETKTESSIAEETPPIVITEIKDDKEPSCEVADVIKGMEPIVEEPAMNEDIEELQNVGDVLEKECDEILSKVQDVTNLDNISVKPLLQPIVEESMETENTDSNDIVDRILDGELELELKQCAEEAQASEVKESTKNEDTISANTEVNDNKETNTTSVTEETKVENGVPEKEEVVNGSSSVISNENGVSDTAESHSDDSDNKTPPEDKPETSAEAKDASEPEEGHVNGKVINGAMETKQNGDSGSDEELKSRLSVENGKEVVNGSNGDSVAVENGVSDKKVEAEVTEIKVKTVPTDEPSTELIEQPTEA